MKTKKDKQYDLPVFKKKNKWKISVLLPIFNAIWKYKILHTKNAQFNEKLSDHFKLWIFVIWNYTTLKRCECCGQIIESLITIWNYTTLKHYKALNEWFLGLITIWNYTAIKRKSSRAVCIYAFYYHMKLHYYQTTAFVIWVVSPVYYHMKLHYYQTSHCERILLD